VSQYILALDQGTTSSRAILFSSEGHPVAVAQQEIRQFYPEPGWVEHDPEEIWEAQIACARIALHQAGLTGADVAAIGITNQRETTILWDRTTGRHVYPAIVWQDRRTADHCDALQTNAPMIQERTGLVLDAYFSATKLAWLLENVPGARSAAEAGQLAFGTVDSFLLWRLTHGIVHATDLTNASRTMLFDIHRREWCPELLELFQIPRQVLPEVVPSSGVIGNTSVLGGSIPISGIAGDQQAATFGQACLAPGQAKATFGTGCFILMPTIDAVASRHKLLTTISATGGFALEGSVFVAGAAIQWLRDGLGLIKDAREAEALARTVPDAGGVTVVPAFTGLGAPYWDAYARGAIFGITRGTNKAHIVRATLESIAHQCADVLEAMQNDGAALSEIRVDGGASANNLLLQIQADLIGMPVVRPKVTETTSAGAAYLAGLGCSFWTRVDDLWQLDRRFEPAMPADERITAREIWRDAIRRVR